MSFEITPEMVREMEGHLPFEIKDPPKRWQWCADYLNETLKDPAVVCPCCNIARNGELP